MLRARATRRRVKQSESQRKVILRNLITVEIFHWYSKNINWISSFWGWAKGQKNEPLPSVSHCNELFLCGVCSLRMQSPPNLQAQPEGRGGRNTWMVHMCLAVFEQRMNRVILSTKPSESPHATPTPPLPLFNFSSYCPPLNG